ncbi:hypothetical protein B0H19DRAFT_1106977, partial [Mycena capillaripes]
MQTESELKKLTVPQLKALCKEKKITGYSKLGKDAIVQKLLGTASTTSIAASSAPTIAQTTTPDNSAAIQSPLCSSESLPLTLTAPSSTAPSSDPPPPNPTPDATTSLR